MIYKIISEPEWVNFQRTGVFTGSAVDIADGYIHFSTAAQAVDTAAKHFAGQDNLVLLEVDEQTLGDELKFEPSRGGDLFPHLYAKLGLEKISNDWPLPIDPSSGQHSFPTEMVA